MKYRATTILALLVLLLGAYFLVWERGDIRDRDRLSGIRRALRLDAERIDGLVVEDAVLGRVECRRRGGDWMLVEPIAARANTSLVRQILTALQELPRGEVILPDRHDRNAYAHYGLEPPRASIAVVQGTATNRLFIGRPSPLGDGVYVRREGQDGIVRIPVALRDLVPDRLDSLRSRTLLGGDPSAIRRLDIRNDSGYIQLARSPSAPWRILQPVATRADPVPVDTLIRELLACTIVEFVQDRVADFTPYGLDARSAATAILDTDGGSGSQMISFGDPVASSPGLVYARLQGENSVYAVPEAAAQALEVRLDDLRDRRIPGLVIPSRIRGIRAESGDTVLELLRDASGAWRIERPRRVPADPDAVNALLAGWAGVRITAFEPPPAPSAASSLPPPPEPVYTRSLWITLQGESDPVLLRMGPLDPGTPHDGSCRIRIADESASAIASPATLLDFPLAAEAYQSLDVLSIPADNILAVDYHSPARNLSVRREPITGEWLQPPADFPALLEALSPLRAAEWLPVPEGLDRAEPRATLRITQTGRLTLSNTLLFHPGGIVLLRGHPTAFRLAEDSPLARWMAVSDAPAAQSAEPEPADAGNGDAP